MCLSLRKVLGFGLVWFGLAIGFVQAVPLSIQPNMVSYAGELTDSESHLQYLNARYYNTQLLRFISWDSVDLINRFAYADGNPVMNEDPSGHDPISIIAMLDIIHQCLNQEQPTQLIEKVLRAHLPNNAVGQPSYLKEISDITINGDVYRFIHTVDLSNGDHIYSIPRLLLPNEIDGLSSKDFGQAQAAIIGHGEHSVFYDTHPSHTGRSLLTYRSGAAENAPQTMRDMIERVTKNTETFQNADYAEYERDYLMGLYNDDSFVTLLRPTKKQWLKYKNFGHYDFAKDGLLREINTSQD